MVNISIKGIGEYYANDAKLLAETDSVAYNRFPLYVSFFFLVAPGFQPRASPTLGKCSTALLTPVLFCFVNYC